MRNCEGEEAGRAPRERPHAARTTAAAATAHGRSLEARGPGAATAAPGAERSWRIPSSCRPTSFAVCHRSSGSLARQIATTRSSARGAREALRETGSGSSRRIDPMSEARVAPEKA